MDEVFVRACEVAQEKWISELPLPEEEHVFTEEYDHRMKRLFHKMRGNKYHRTTKTTFSILIAAALAMLLMLGSLAYAPVRNFLIQVFDDHTEFKSESSGLTSIGTDIYFGYIPDGFELVEREIDGKACALDVEGRSGFSSDYHFENDDGRWIDVSKHPAGGQLDVDSEDYPIEIIGHDDTVYYLSFSEPDIYGVYCLKSGTQYDLGGRLTREEALKMAYQMR